MRHLPIIASFSEDTLNVELCQFSNVTLITSETRRDFTAKFPRHNRYFSNGDKPLVALLKRKGYVMLTYDGQDFLLNDNEVVLFDDNVHHSWVMEACDLEIFYYRQKGVSENPITKGDYCLDTYFQDYNA